MEERITSMIPRYGKLNKTYTEITSGDGLSFEKQKFIHDFYKEYEDTQTFEKAIISLMLETEGTHFSILLNSLKREIENNISMYNTCREFSTVSILNISAGSMKDVMTGTSKDKCKSQTNITGNLWKLTDLWRQSVSGNMIVRKRKGWKKIRAVQTGIRQGESQAG